MTTQPATFSYDVFLSYARPDRAWVDQELLAPLEAAGLRVCIDYRDFAPAAAILDEIERAIRSSRKTLFVFSPAYRQSEWSQLEQSRRETRLVFGDLSGLVSTRSDFQLLCS